jgi:hypothetical protein
MVAIQLAAAATGAAVATWVVILHLGAGWQLMAVAVTVASLLASAPMLFPVDDPLTAALRALARRSSGVLRWRLDRALALRQRLAAQTERVAAGNRGKLDRGFESLLQVAQRRQVATDEAAETLDASLAQHLTVLERGVSALERRSAVRSDLDRRGVEELQREAEEIESEIEALIEVSGEPVVAGAHG